MTLKTTSTLGLLVAAIHAFALQAADLEATTNTFPGEGPSCRDLCDQFGGSIVSKIDLNADGSSRWRSLVRGGRMFSSVLSPKA